MTDLAAVLFDMDGTLVETESLWHESEIITMRQFGQTWSDEEQQFALGGPFDVVAQYMATKAAVPLSEVGDALLRNIEHLMRTRDWEVQPGVRELHDEIIAAGLPVGLVTNSFRLLADIVLAESGLHFDVVVTGDETAQNKPHPEPYLSACRQLHVEPSAVCVLEDSTTGIASALAAGCVVIAIPHQGTISETDRVTVVTSVADVQLATLRERVA
jgi:HAD superfamily hydrolase (TIGR01509 family)